MAQPTSFAEEEDAIILATLEVPSSEVNAQLIAAGFAARSPQSIRSRRHRLLNRTRDQAKVDSSADALIQALHQRKALARQEESLLKSLAETRAALTEVEDEVIAAMQRTQSELRSEE